MLIPEWSPELAPDGVSFKVNVSRVQGQRATAKFKDNVCLQSFTWYTDKKENQIFLIYREIQSGAVAKSFMTNGLLIYGEIFSHFLINVLGSPSTYMTLQLLHSEFPYIWGKFYLIFFQCTILPCYFRKSGIISALKIPYLWRKGTAASFGRR